MDATRPLWLRPVRASSIKSKTGCVTCKRRHIKCPGEKPTCSRCEKAKHSCEYAAEQPKQHARWHVRFKEDDTGIPGSLRQVRFENESERHCLEYFQQRSAWAIGPALGWAAWGSFVLQMSEQDTTVRHALVGLGAMNDHHATTRGLRCGSDDRGLLEFSYDQYGKAIHQLRRRIHSPKRISPIAAMLVCTLFAVFDFLQGDDLAAAAHLRAGVTILRGFVAGSVLDEYSLEPNDGSTEQIRQKQMPELQRNFVEAFSHLDYFSLWWSNGEALLPEVTWIRGLVPHPTDISRGDIQSLLFHYFELEKRVHEFLRRVKSGPERSSPRRSFNVRRSELLDKLAGSYARCCAIYDAESSEENRKGQMVLKINHENLRVMLLAMQHDGRPVYQPFGAEFATIVDAAVAVGADITPSKIQFQSFSFSHGLIHPLYIAATCCCDPHTCQRAVGFLESFQFAEGVWNPQLMARIARRKLRERGQSDTVV